MQAMQLGTGRQYRVTKDRCHLSWWEPYAPSAYRSRHQHLQVGDVITYLGARDCIGSDPVPVDRFSMGDIEGEFSPCDWGRADRSCLEEVQ